MARKIRDDLDGVVYAYDEGGKTVRLAGGDEVPDGVTVGDHLTDAPAPTDEENVEGQPLEKLSVKELKALADEAGIDLDGATKKADLIAAIEAAETVPTVSGDDDSDDDGSDES